jgi:hypothetical protein
MPPRPSSHPDDPRNAPPVPVSLCLAPSVSLHHMCMSIRSLYLSHDWKHSMDALIAWLHSLPSLCALTIFFKITEDDIIQLIGTTG